MNITSYSELVEYLENNAKITISKETDSCGDTKIMAALIIRDEYDCNVVALAETDWCMHDKQDRWLSSYQECSIR